MSFGGARGDLAEGQLLGDASAHAHRDAVLELLARPVVLLLGGQLLGDAQGHAARDDRDLVQGIGVGKERGEEGVAALVEGGDLLLRVGDDHALPLGPHEDLVLGALEVAHEDELLVVAGGQERRLVDQVREIGPREPGGGPRQHADVHVVGEGDLAGVHLQDAFAAAEVGPRDHHPAGRSGRAAASAGSRTSGRLVAAIRMTPSFDSKPSISTRSWFRVCSRSSWPPPRPAPRWRPTASISSMKMMQGAFFLPCSKRSRTREAPTPTNISTKSEPEMEKNGTLASPGDGAGQEGLARPRRAHEQHALGDAAAELLELLGLAQELDDLLQLFLGLVHPGHVLEGDLLLLRGQELGLRLAEGEGLVPPALHLAHEEDPEADEQQEGGPRRSACWPRWGSGRAGSSRSPSWRAGCRRACRSPAARRCGTLHRSPRSGP